MGVWKKFSLLALIVLGAFSAAWNFAPGFKTEVSARAVQARNSLLLVPQVEIRGHERLSEAELRRARLAGQNLPLTTAISNRRARALVQSPWVEDVQVEREALPARLVLNVKEAQPWMIAQMLGKSWVVSDKGELLQTLDALRAPELMLELSELPRLSFANADTRDVRENVQARFKTAVQQLKLLRAAGEFPFALGEYIVRDEGSLELVPVECERYPRVIAKFADFRGAEESLARLRAVMGDLAQSANGIKASEVDLRFEGQVVVR